MNKYTNLINITFKHWQQVKLKLLRYKKNLIKERYKEEYEEGSDLLWPSDKEDKITRQFYKDLSILSNNINYSKKKKLKLFEQVVRIIKDKGWG